MVVCSEGSTSQNITEGRLDQTDEKEGGKGGRKGGRKENGREKGGKGRPGEH